MFTSTARHDACGRHFDSVKIWAQDESSTRIEELLRENKELRDRTRALTATVMDLSKLIERLENTNRSRT